MITRTSFTDEIIPIVEFRSDEGMLISRRGTTNTFRLPKDMKIGEWMLPDDFPRIERLGIEIPDFIRQSAQSVKADTGAHETKPALFVETQEDIEQGTFKKRLRFVFIKAVKATETKTELKREVLASLMARLFLGDLAAETLFINGPDGRLFKHNGYHYLASIGILPNFQDYASLGKASASAWWQNALYISRIVNKCWPKKHHKENFASKLARSRADQALIRAQAIEFTHVPAILMTALLIENEDLHPHNWGPNGMIDFGKCLWEAIVEEKPSIYSRAGLRTYFKEKLFGYTSGFAINRDNIRNFPMLDYSARYWPVQGFKFYLRLFLAKGNSYTPDDGRILQERFKEAEAQRNYQRALFEILLLPIEEILQLIVKAVLPDDETRIQVYVHMLARVQKLRQLLLIDHSFHTYLFSLRGDQVSQIQQSLINRLLAQFGKNYKLDIQVKYYGLVTDSQLFFQVIQDLSEQFMRNQETRKQLITALYDVHEKEIQHQRKALPTPSAREEILSTFFSDKEYDGLRQIFGRYFDDEKNLSLYQHIETLIANLLINYHGEAYYDLCVLQFRYLDSLYIQIALLKAKLLPIPTEVGTNTFPADRRSLSQDDKRLMSILARVNSLFAQDIQEYAVKKLAKHSIPDFQKVIQSIDKENIRLHRLIKAYKGCIEKIQKYSCLSCYGFILRDTQSVVDATESVDEAIFAITYAAYFLSLNNYSETKCHNGPIVSSTPLSREPSILPISILVRISGGINRDNDSIQTLENYDPVEHLRSNQHSNIDLVLESSHKLTRAIYRRRHLDRGPFAILDYFNCCHKNTWQYVLSQRKYGGMAKMLVRLSDTLYALTIQSFTTEQEKNDFFRNHINQLILLYKPDYMPGSRKQVLFNFSAFVMFLSLVFSITAAIALAFPLSSAQASTLLFSEFITIPGFISFGFVALNVRRRNVAKSLEHHISAINESVTGSKLSVSPTSRAETIIDQISLNPVWCNFYVNSSQKQSASSEPLLACSSST